MEGFKENIFPIYDDKILEEEARYKKEEKMLELKTVLLITKDLRDF